jgi:AMP deaminase
VARSENGSPLTLRHIFNSVVGVNAWEASVDLLNVHALGTCFHRFDKFNSKYNPFGQALLREVFLKTDNMIKGRYLAEITKEVVTDLEDGKYQFVEWRVSIYGKSYDEWSKLSRWIIDNNLTSKQVKTICLSLLKSLL